MAKFRVFHSLVHYNIFRTILSLDFIPPQFSDRNTLVKSVSLSFPTYWCFSGSRAQPSFISVVYDFLG